MLGAARVQVDFWDKENGYYLNGTYYGAKNLLGVGAAIQAQDGDTATTVDFLLEKKLGDDGGVLTIESEYANYNQLGGYDGRYAIERRRIRARRAFSSRSRSAWASSRCSANTPRQPSAKAAHSQDYDQNTTEFNFNYVIKEFNARVMFFVINTDFSAVKTSGTAGRRRPAAPDVSTPLTTKESSMKRLTGTAHGVRDRRRARIDDTAHRRQDTIKVGVLHSLSGTMAISETTLKDTVLMMIDEQNKKGGLLGRKLEAVVVDPASNWPLFAEKAAQLLEKDKVAVVFGCWTSVSRKSVLPVFEKNNGLLFYPVQYEGEESSKNVIYTGAAPNQQAIPAVDYLMNDVGVKRWVLEGTDYVYPRTTNKILEAYLHREGSAEGRHLDQLHAVRSCRLADAGRRDQEVRIGRQEDGGRLHHQRRRQRAVLQGARQPEDFGGGHSGRRVLGWRGRAVGPRRTKPLVGHLAAWNYFESISTPANKAFIDSGRPTSRTRSGRRTTRWKRTTSASTCG